MKVLQKVNTPYQNFEKSFYILFYAEKTLFTWTETSCIDKGKQEGVYKAKSRKVSDHPKNSMSVVW